MVRRASGKISASGYLSALCRLKTKGSVSFNDMAGTIGLSAGAAVSKQAVWKRTNHSERYYKLMDWNIYITNVPPAVWSSKDVDAVYPLRWRIETIFKAWKSNMCLEHLHQSISETQLIFLPARGQGYCFLGRQRYPKAHCRCRYRNPEGSRL